MVMDVPQPPKMLHLQVLPVTEHGQSPGYVSLEVKPELFGRVQQMSAVCRQFRYCEISDYFGEAIWPDSEMGEPESEKLVVDSAGFYLQAYTRAGEPVESSPVSTTCLLEILNDSTGQRHWTGHDLQGASQVSQSQARTFRDELIEAGVIDRGEALGLDIPDHAEEGEKTCQSDLRERN